MATSEFLAGCIYSIMQQKHSSVNRFALLELGTAPSSRGREYMDFAEALHIVSGDSAGGTLKFALRLRRDRVLINEDPVSVGPAPFTGDLASWKSSREQFLARLHTEWSDFSFDHFSDNGLLANARRLAEPGDKVLWAGAGLPDQLTISWVAVLARMFGANESDLHVVQFERIGPKQYVRMMGELS